MKRHTWFAALMGAALISRAQAQSCSTNDVGILSLRGQFDSTRSYTRGDEVMYGGALYASCLPHNTGNVPGTQGTPWFLVQASGPSTPVTYGTAAGTAAAGNDPRIVNALQSSGGSMYGPLLLAADPTAAQQAATKAYVDAHAGSATSNNSATPFTSPAGFDSTNTSNYAGLTAMQPGATPEVPQGYFGETGLPARSPGWTVTPGQYPTVPSIWVLGASTPAATPGNFHSAATTTPINGTGAILTSGALISDPTQQQAIASKNYVDTTRLQLGTTASTATAGNDSRVVNAVNRTGDTLTGTLVLAGDPTAPSQAATKNYVDTKVAGISPSNGVAANARIDKSSWGNGTPNSINPGPLLLQIYNPLNQPLNVLSIVLKADQGTTTATLYDDQGNAIAPALTGTPNAATATPSGISFGPGRGGELRINTDGAATKVLAEVTYSQNATTGTSASTIPTTTPDTVADGGQQYPDGSTFAGNSNTSPAQGSRVFVKVEALGTNTSASNTPTITWNDTGTATGTLATPVYVDCSPDGSFCAYYFTDTLSTPGNRYYHVSGWSSGTAPQYPGFTVAVVTPSAGSTGAIVNTAGGFIARDGTQNSTCAAVTPTQPNQLAVSFIAFNSGVSGTPTNSLGPINTTLFPKSTVASGLISQATSPVWTADSGTATYASCRTFVVQ